MNLVCPSCQNSLAVEGDRTPQEIVCPSCGSTFRTQDRETIPYAVDPHATRLSQAENTSAARASPASFPTIPGYEILSILGQGGMGVVYKARQIGLNRLVALKMILAGPHADNEALARFRTEAEAVAQVKHPNIVQIHEIGRHNNLPFFSLEYVEGGTLADKTQGKPQPAQSSAQLVETLARGIQVAHDAGIVHRDLKPSNILLTPDGTPKISDFGLAKKLQEGPGQTYSGDILGTPNYMAPEQASGKTKEIGPLSDVYSLGAILYELLTGRPPFLAETLLDTLNQVKTEEPVAPRALNPKVPRDLETICLKCLRKQPAHRYGSALALAEDLARFQAGEPILARPVGSVERAWRWAKRKPTAAGLIAAGILLVVGIFGGTLWYQTDRARQERDEVTRQSEKAQKLALTEQGVRQALEQAGKHRDELHAVLSKQGGVQELLNRPERWNFLIQAAQSHVAQARRLMARSEGNLAEELTQEMEKLEGQLGTAEAERTLAVRLEEIRMETITFVEGKFAHAKAPAKYLTALERFAILKDDPARVAERFRLSTIHEQLVAAVDHWAWVTFKTGETNVSEELLALARLAAPDPIWGDRLRQLDVWRDKKTLQTLMEKGPPEGLSPQLLTLIGNLLEGHPTREYWLRRARNQHPMDFWLNFSLAHAIGDTNPLEGSGFVHVALTLRPKSAAAYDSLGIAFARRKQLPEAIAAFNKAIELEPSFARAYNHLGGVLRDQNKLPEAIAALTKAIQLDPKDVEACTNLGTVFLDQKKLPEAIAAYHKALDLDPKFAGAYNHLGVAFFDQRKFREAIAAFHKAIELDPKYAMAYYNLGNGLSEQKQLSEAVAAYHEAIKLDPKYVEAYVNLGIALSEQKKLAEAIAAYDNAVALDPTFAQAYRNLGSALHEQNQLPQAIAAYRKVTELDPKDAKAHNSLGMVLGEQKKMSEASAAFRKAIEFDPKYKQAYYNLGIALSEQKQLSEAIANYHKAIELDPKYAKAYYSLGNAFRDQQKLPQAVAAFQKAVEIDPRFSQAHGGLGSVLLQQGLFSEAAEATRKALSSLPASHSLRPLYEQRRKTCERLAFLEKRLPLVLDGKESAEPDTLLEMALMAQDYKQRYATAARLYQEAFKARAALAEDLYKQHRLDAACMAALAGAGQGEETRKLSADNKTKLRHTASDWLQADLDSYARLLKEGKPDGVLFTAQRLAHWQIDRDLAGVREPKLVRLLPEDESKAWLKLWSDVEALRKDARSRYTETQHQGILSADKREQIHDLKMDAGQSYTIDMSSPQFDTYLRLEDAKGKVLAENDDISKDNLNSRILFTPPQGATYRIVATSFEGSGSGAYTLIVREFSGNNK